MQEMEARKQRLEAIRKSRQSQQHQQRHDLAQKKQQQRAQQATTSTSAEDVVLSDEVCRRRTASAGPRVLFHADAMRKITHSKSKSSTK